MRRLVAVAALSFSLLAALALVGCGSSKPHVWVAPPGPHALTACVSADCGPYAVTLRWDVTIANQTGTFVFVNGTQVANVTTAVFTFSGLDCATSYTFGVEAHDGSGNVTSLYTTPYTTPACGLVNTALPLISGSPVSGQTLSTTTGTWTGFPTSFSYQWQRCSPSCVNISAATSSTYVLQAADVGATIDVAVTATNPSGSNTATSAQTATISGSGGTAPVNSTAPYFTQSTGGATCTSGCAIQGQTVAVTTGTWTCSGGCGTLTYTYQWQHCTTSAAQPPVTSACTNISGATASTYTVAAGDVGHSLSPVVTAANNGTPGTGTTAAGSTCNQASLPLGGSGSASTSGTSGGAAPNAPAGCSPISAVAGASQAAEKVCTNAPITCGFPDELVPGNVGPTGALTTVSGVCGCLPSGATFSAGTLTVSGNNVTVQNVLLNGNFNITGTNDTITNSHVTSGTNNAGGTNWTLSHDWIEGDSDWNVNSGGTGTGTISFSFFNNGCEDVDGQGINLHDSYLMSNKFFQGCHYETTYVPGGTSPSGIPATTYEHNVHVNNFPDNWDIFFDNHAFSACGDFNITLDNALIVNQGGFAFGGTTSGDCSSNNAITNNRISQAYAATGGSFGTCGLNQTPTAVTFTNNAFDDTLTAIPVANC